MGLQQASILYKDRLYPHYYLCRYLPVSAGKDSLSHSLLKFKRGRQPDLDAWIDCSLEMLAPTPIPPHSFIIRALHHEETLLPQQPHTSLDKLGSALARQFNSHYHPRLLRKSFPVKESKGLTREQREAGLQDLYIIDKTQLSIPPTAAPSIPSGSATISPDTQNSKSKIQNNHITPPPSFLLVDDILTTGATMRMIIAAILQVYPAANLTLFTLAKADYDTGFNQSAPLRGQNYPMGQDNSPTVAEDEINYSPEQLKTRIRSDTF